MSDPARPDLTARTPPRAADDRPDPADPAPAPEGRQAPSGPPAKHRPMVAIDEYAAEIVELGLAIRAYRRAEGGGMVGPAGGEDDDQGEQDDDQQEAKKRRNGVSAVCGCEKPRRIRVAWTVWEGGPITCGVCGQEFHDPDATEQDEQEGDE